MDPNDFNDSGSAERVLIQKGGVLPSHVPHLPLSELTLSARTVSPLALARSALRPGPHPSRAPYAADRLEHARIVHEITSRKRDRQFVAPELLHALGTDDTPATDEEPSP